MWRKKKERTKDGDKKKQIKFDPSLETQCNAQVKKVYQIIKKCTGSLGGNGSFGAIYGEATMGCMQRVINLMKEHCEFDATCAFIDIGSGLGKPNLHVAQDPGVKISFGIELEKVRNNLGIHNLYHVMKHTLFSTPEHHGNIFLQHGDAVEASSFDPFTHVYMFDIGFPPVTLEKIAKIFNLSQAPYLICYHSPHLVIDEYGFEVDFIIQFQTSLHGSGESRTGYIYKHIGKELKDFNHSIVAPMFEKGVRMILDEDKSALLEYIENNRKEQFESSRPKRRCRR